MSDIEIQGFLKKLASSRPLRPWQTRYFSLKQFQSQYHLFYYRHTNATAAAAPPAAAAPTPITFATMPPPGTSRSSFSVSRSLRAPSASQTMTMSSVLDSASLGLGDDSKVLVPVASYPVASVVDVVYPVEGDSCRFRLILQDAHAVEYVPAATARAGFSWEVVVGDSTYKGFPAAESTGARTKFGRRRSSSSDKFRHLDLLANESIDAAQWVKQIKKAKELEEQLRNCLSPSEHPKPEMEQDGLTSPGSLTLPWMGLVQFGSKDREISRSVSDPVLTVTSPGHSVSESSSFGRRSSFSCDGEMKMFSSDSKTFEASIPTKFVVPVEAVKKVLNDSYRNSSGIPPVLDIDNVTRHVVKNFTDRILPEEDAELWTLKPSATTLRALESAKSEGRGLSTFQEALAKKLAAKTFSTFGSVDEDLRKHVLDLYRVQIYDLNCSDNLMLKRILEIINADELGSHIVGQFSETTKDVTGFVLRRNTSGIELEHLKAVPRTFSGSLREALTGRSSKRRSLPIGFAKKGLRLKIDDADDVYTRRESYVSSPAVYKPAPTEEEHKLTECIFVCSSKVPPTIVKLRPNLLKHMCEMESNYQPSPGKADASIWGKTSSKEVCSIPGCPLYDSFSVPKTLTLCGIHCQILSSNIRKQLVRASRKRLWRNIAAEFVDRESCASLLMSVLKRTVAPDDDISETLDAETRAIELFWYTEQARVAASHVCVNQTNCRTCCELSETMLQFIHDGFSARGVRPPIVASGLTFDTTKAILGMLVREKWQPEQALILSQAAKQPALWRVLMGLLSFDEKVISIASKRLIVEDLVSLLHNNPVNLASMLSQKRWWTWINDGLISLYSVVLSGGMKSSQADECFRLLLHLLSNLLSHSFFKDENFNPLLLACLGDLSTKTEIALRKSESWKLSQILLTVMTRHLAKMEKFFMREFSERCWLNLAEFLKIVAHFVFGMSGSTLSNYGLHWQGILPMTALEMHLRLPKSLSSPDGQGTVPRVKGMGTSGARMKRAEVERVFDEGMEVDSDEDNEEKEELPIKIGSKPRRHPKDPDRTLSVQLITKEQAEDLALVRLVVGMIPKSRIEECTLMQQIMMNAEDRKSMNSIRVLTDFMEESIDFLHIMEAIYNSKPEIKDSCRVICKEWLGSIEGDISKAKERARSSATRRKILDDLSRQL